MKYLIIRLLKLAELQAAKSPEYIALLADFKAEFARIEKEENKIEFTRINNDVNGNPRYVVHFLQLNTREELDSVEYIPNKYELALKRAHKLGGRKFHNKQYGGGIVFQSYNNDTLEADIKALRGW